LIQYVNFHSVFNDCRLASITEGGIDDSIHRGKIPAEVARLDKKHELPTISVYLAIIID
jgi:glycerate kinase